MREPTGREHLTPVQIGDTSATERAGFRGCRRQWFLVAVHRLDSGGGNVHAFLGMVYHKGLEAYYLGLQAGKPVEDAEADALDAFQEAYDRESAVMSERLGIAWPAVQPEYREFGEMGMEMLQNYLDRERNDPMLDEVIAVEFRVRVPIEGGGFLSVQTDVVGLKDGRLRVADHKTASRPPSVAHLDIDDQLTAEVYSWWKHSGEFPVEAVYNVSMKKRVAPPRLIRKDTALSKDKGQATTYEAYLRAIVEHGFSVADYEDFLQFLKEREERGEDPLFIREVTFRTPGQMDSFHRDLEQEFRDMREVAAEPERAYPNPTPGNCRYCPVKSICFTIQDGGDVEAVIKAGYTIADARRPTDGILIPTEEVPH